MSLACARCACRSGLLMRLGGSLDWRARDAARLWETLALSDEQLISALGGSMRERLSAWHAACSHAAYSHAACSHAAADGPPGDGERPSGSHGPGSHAPGSHGPGSRTVRDASPGESWRDGVQRVCRHSEAYPRALRGTPLAPHELYVMGGVSRLRALLDEPVVAIVGAGRCSDHGFELARSLAHQLAQAGVSVTAQLADGVGHGALAGAVQAGGHGIGVLAGDVRACAPSCCRAVRQGLARTGCVISELPCGSSARRWTRLACARTLALLADLVIVVEATDDGRELACAELARSIGTKTGAVPGRVSSPCSQGCNRLIKEGAELVRDARDALDLLYDAPAGCRDAPAASLEPRLRTMLARIRAGSDTLCKLSAGAGAGEALADLAELELRGLVVRGDGGRYVPCAVAPCG